MPRLSASSANFWWVQCVIRRALFARGLQAIATIAQICPALKVAGVPGRGTSARRSATGPLPRDQRPRRCCTVDRAAPSRRAFPRKPYPAAAAATIRARSATCCEYTFWRKTVSSCVCSRSLTTTGGASIQGISVHLCCYAKHQVTRYSPEGALGLPQSIRSRVESLVT